MTRSTPSGPRNNERVHEEIETMKHEDSIVLGVVQELRDCIIDHLQVFARDTLT